MSGFPLHGALPPCLGTGPPLSAAGGWPRCHPWCQDGENAAQTPLGTKYSLPGPKTEANAACSGLGAGLAAAHHPRPQDLGPCPAATPLSSLWSSRAGSLLGGCPFSGSTWDPNSRVCALYHPLEDGDTLRAHPTSPASSVLASVSRSKAGAAGEWAAVGLGAHEVSALPDACHPPHYGRDDTPAAAKPEGCKD